MKYKVKLTESAFRRLTFQDYAPGPTIHGVFQVPLKKYEGLEGWFMEHMRLTGGQVEGIEQAFEARQISFSCAEPHRINAFHIHPKEVQDELWCVVQGKLKVWLVDLRADSPTVELKQGIMLSGDSPCLLHIPSGVAHGYQAGPQGALLVYAVTTPFNVEDPNEGRLPWDLFGQELWDEDRG